ncbi:phosphatidylserine decarboxylase [Bacillus ectoiniformans]|uniref:phosphatidylserine decarboxylase n=1 Tax=Bacillus ectoiniformans TaxID=1494429 RepID=UPI0019574E56|nr:phosphatidylserine decarboxylase [Bacillus ectoiniformans]
MREQLYQCLIELTNKKWSSKLLQHYTGSSISKPMIRRFMKFYQINEKEMEHSADDYQTLHDFFMRTLHSEARTIDKGDLHVTSPVDAMLADSGVIEPDSVITVKGKPYSVEEMLGDKSKAAFYTGGHYMVLYLSPAHYHRIHSPADGTVVDRWTLGKHSYPVNRIGLAYGKAPLAKNYRDITELQHSKAKMAIVKVGAMFVNSIERTHENPVWKQGEEVAYFNFGSTVVMLFEPDTFVQDNQYSVPCEVKVGQKLGILKEGNV